MLFGEKLYPGDLEAFWLPLAEQSCKTLRTVWITQQCFCSLPACRAGAVFQSMHHVQCASVFPRKLEHFVRTALLHDQVSCTTRKFRSWRVAVWERLSPIHPWGWCRRKGSGGQEANPVQCYWEKSCWQDKQKNGDRISSQLCPPFLALASTSSICIQIPGKLTVHEDFLQKSLQKHDAVYGWLLWHVILTYFITERKVTVHLRSSVLAQETVQTGRTSSDISCRSCLQKVWQKGKTHVMPHLANSKALDPSLRVTA